MNISCAAWAGEAVGSDCSESAGNVGAFLAMPLLPLHGEGDHLDLLVPLLLLVFDLRSGFGNLWGDVELSSSRSWHGSRSLGRSRSARPPGWCSRAWRTSCGGSTTSCRQMKLVS